jgi:predicted ATP-grasp superfamily ATP-dependent carboligase
VSDNIFANFDHQLIVEFDNDQLLDYRARRPIMYFEKDHIADYEPATLGIFLVYDEARQPFLFLHGYEPDFKWEAFVDALLGLIESFGVSQVSWVHSIPFPIPHTRPIGVTVSGNRRDLIDSTSEWKPQTQVPGNVLHLLEYRASSIGIPMVGFVLLIPHYLGDSEYPAAAVKALELLSLGTGLVFSTDALREEATVFSKKLSQQLEENEELKRMVANLEQGYLSERSTPGRPNVSKPETPMPTADEIAAELEDYLASRRRNQSDEEK